MASCFQSQWFVASIKPLRKHRNGAAVGSESVNVFVNINGLKPGRSLKLRREISNGYSLVAGKDWRIHCGDFQGKDNGQRPEPTTEAEKVVEEFYNSINNRNVSQLAALLSDDCCYEDALFDSPFIRKEAVSTFAARLMNAMGLNVKFDAQAFSTGSFGVEAQWVLKWKSEEIPFMQGFNSFELKLNEDKLLISKIRGLDEELSVKPGERILKVLKIISTILDESLSDIEGNH